MTPAKEPAPRAETPGGNYKWAVIGMLWFICFFNYADRVAVSSVFPLLRDEFHFDKEQLGLIGAAFTWVYAFTAPFAGPVADRFSRKVVIISGLYVWSIVTGFTALCTRFWQFLFVRGAEGLGETFYFPASMSLVSDYHDRSTRSRAMGLHQTSVYAGTIGGSFLAGLLGERYGWRYPFLIFGALGIALGVVLHTFIREPQRDEAERRAAALHGSAVIEGGEPEQISMSRFLREWLRTPTALMLAAAFFGANFVALVFLTWMPTFLNEKFKLKLAMAGLEATVYIQLASAMGALLSGVLADRWTGRHAGGRILVQAVGAALGAPFIFLCGYTTEKSALVWSMTAFGLCKGLYDGNIWASLYDVVPASRRAAAVGLMNMIAWLGGGLGAWAVGAAATRGVSMSAAISSTAGIYVGVAALLLAAGFVTAPRDSARTLAT